MKQNRWKDIGRARKFLGLPEQVSRREIQEAYRRKCRDLHPDRNPGVDASEEMAGLNWAYKVLMEYAEHYTISLKKNENGMTDEEWWMYRFGQDTIWAGERGRS